jgi:hypothetical protein
LTIKCEGVKILTVQELISLLQQVDNKDKQVKLSVNDVVTGNFHLNDHISTRLYLSNAEEEGYKPQPFE